MKKLLSLGMAMLMMLALIVGCTPAAPATSEAPAASSTAPAAQSTAPAASAAAPATSEAPAGEPKAVSMNLGSEPPEMNSILTTSTGSMNVLRHIVDGLVKLDPSDAPIPGIAESWTISDDNLTYTFTLRKDAVWSNGEPVTAKDFIFAWDTLFTGETAAPYAATWAALILGAMEKLEGTAPSADLQAKLTEGGYDNVGYKMLDDYTIQMTTTGAYPYFLSVLAFPNMFPVNEKGYNEIGAGQYGDEAEYLVTNGAFNITGWQHESNIVLEKNPNYYDAANIKIDQITMEMIKDSNTALNTYLAGEIDMIGLNGDQAIQMRGEGREVLGYNDGSTWYFEFNTTLKGLNNPKIRKALTMAIDVDAFIKNVVKLEASTVANCLTPLAINDGTFTTAVGDLLNRPTDGDYSAVVALLEEGLAEEGMTVADLKQFVLITDDTDTATRNAAFFQEQWKVNLGVEITIEQMTYESRLERMQNKDFSIVMAGWGPDYNDPMTFLDLMITGNGNNHTSYTNPDYDALIAAAMAESDAAKRQEILINAEKLLMEEMPIGPIYNRAREFITSDRLSGVVRTAFTDISLLYAEVSE